MERIKIGVREAKMHLSRYLKTVQNGGEVIITDRGRPVGKIVPLEDAEMPLSERLKHLEHKGIIEPQRDKSGLKSHAPVAVEQDIAQKYLQEDRNGKH